jgi:hypothetical protein
VDITAEADATAAYQAALAAWQDEIAAWCRTHGVPYVSVVTDFPLAPFVTRVLREQGIVA